MKSEAKRGEKNQSLLTSQTPDPAGGLQLCHSTMVTDITQNLSVYVLPWDNTRVTTNPPPTDEGQKQIITVFTRGW